MSRHKLRVVSKSLFLSTGIVCLCGLLFVAFNRNDILYLGQGRIITFFDDWYEIDSCLRRFQIRSNFIQLIYDGCDVEFCSEPSHEYAAVFADNGELVGILDHTLKSSSLLIMYDFSSGQCWPCNVSNAQRDRLFERLYRANPQLREPDYW